MCCCSSIMNGAAADDSVRHHVPGHQLRHIVALATALIVISRPMTLPTRRSFSPMDWHRSPAPTSSSQRRKILRNADKEFVFGTPVWNQPADRKVFALPNRSRVHSPGQCRRAEPFGPWHEQKGADVWSAGRECAPDGAQCMRDFHHKPPPLDWRVD